MSVRDHLTQHERAEALPLVTESARTVAKEAMDENRTEDVVARVGQLLGEHGRPASEARIRDVLDGTDAADVPATLFSDPGERLADTVATLAGRYQRPYPSLLRLRFEFESDFDFAPGQYVTVRYRGTPRAYSVANSPNESGVELCVRRVPGGRLTSALADHLSVGDRVTVRGPNGEFTLQEPSGRDVLFLATGTGVAPLKSMIEYTFEEGRDAVDVTERDVWLFLGTGWRDDLAYRERFRELDDAHDNFHFVPTLSRERALSEWDGETAYVQRTLATYLDGDAVDPSSVPEATRPYLDADPATDHAPTIDPANAEVYACGINAMVYPLVDTVRDLGVPEACIEAEGYG